ncbi:MAG: DinB family protein [Steroidobacter sp.]
MSENVSPLIQQLHTAWSLASYHLETLTTEECLWRPASRGLHVHRDEAGVWRADWPEHEGYDLGPPSIGWITWHMIFWWSMALDHSFGSATLSREQVFWPGTAEAARMRITQLHDAWRSKIERMKETELADSARVRWPFQGRSFAHLIAWCNVELTKNGSELGYARFLYAVR